jgi:hypothetical protein
MVYRSNGVDSAVKAWQISERFQSGLCNLARWMSGAEYEGYFKRRFTRVAQSLACRDFAKD